MELSGTLVRQFRDAVRLPPGVAVLGRRSKTVVPLTLRGVVRCSSCPIWENLSTSYQIFKAAEVHCTNSSQSSQQSLPTTSDSSRLPGLTFNQLQLTDRECSGVQKHSFGQFIARGALIDAEYWAAAWLRAEAQYESGFYAVKRRCSGRDGNSLKCSCIVTSFRSGLFSQELKTNPWLGIEKRPLPIRGMICSSWYNGSGQQELGFCGYPDWGLKSAHYQFWGMICSSWYNGSGATRTRSFRSGLFSQELKTNPWLSEHPHPNHNQSKIRGIEKRPLPILGDDLFLLESNRIPSTQPPE
ncbi:hypothetical protein Scep_025451 [Stephania cephalantha]|uniref:Uncharacterized protein n=1 Tax=Stephania cephalantha TaxID=152367 RepID=A0AAP0ELK9_9MAGN